MHERRRQPARGELAAGRAERGKQPSQLGDLLRGQRRDGLGIPHERLELSLEHLQPTVEAAVRQQLRDQRRTPALQPCETPEEFLPDLERGVARE